MAEEIVRIIRVDTKNSGRSIKDLRNEIKSLKSELDKAVVGSEEFESTLRKLTQTQKSYNEVQQQIRDLSRTNQQNMLNFAKFASNLGKSYSALNAAVGLFADKNEDVQKAMLKVQRTIQLIQGLDGITGLIRDIPKIGAAFKSWFSFLDPIERKVTNIVKGINGADPSKLRGINEAGRQGGSSSASASASARQQYLPAENKELEKQANTYYPALLQQEKNLYKAREATAKKIEEVSSSMGTIKQTTDDITKAILSASNKSIPEAISYLQDIKNGTKTAADVFNELYKTADPEKFVSALKRMGYDTSELARNAQGMASLYADQTIELEKLTKEYAELDSQYKKIQQDIAIQEAGMTKFQKTLAKTGVVGRAAIGMIKTALYSIGIGVVISLLVKAYDWISKIVEKSREMAKINKEISQSTNQIGSKQVVVLKELAIAYNKLGDSAESKRKFLEKYSEKIKETGISIDDLKKAEDVFVNNTDKYINAIMARAKAQATENAAIKIYEQYLNDAYDREQKGEKLTFWQKLASGQFIGQPDMHSKVTQSYLEKNRAKAKKDLDQMEKDMNERLKKMFEDVAKLEQEYSGIFGSITSGGGAKTDWAKEYKEALDALRKYTDDYLDFMKDARTKELDDNRKAYEEDFNNLEDYYKRGIEAAQGNADKIETIRKERAEAVKNLQLKYKRQELDIIERYNDEAFNKEKAELDREYSLLEKQLERNRRLYDTANLREPTQLNYQTKTVKPWSLKTGTGEKYTTYYQTKEDLEIQYKLQVEYNDRVYLLTKARVENENKLLEEERRTLEEKAALLRDQLNSTDVNDLDKRRELADEIIDIENSLFTTKQTIIENEIALDDAQRKLEEDNLNAFLETQEKKRQALLATLDVVSTATGALASMFRMEANNDKKSQEQRERALKAYKAFAITQAIADTWKGANEAYAAMASIPYVGPALGIAASAAAVIAGLANVKAIMSESISSSSQSASVTAPAPMQTAPIEYTRNLVGDKELDEINQPVRCYVLESDISKTQNKVKVTEQNATF